MPHPKQRKQETRQKILSAAARLFAAQGFEATSIEELMHECGLTRGGFYTHFHSKAQLHEEAVALAHTRVSPIEDLQLWASLARDVASATPEVRLGYARTIERVRESLCGEMAGSPLGHDAALAATAMLVGALAVAQSVDDVRLAADMREACRKTARALCDEVIVNQPPAFFWAPVGVPLH